MPPPHEARPKEQQQRQDDPPQRAASFFVWGLVDASVLRGARVPHRPLAGMLYHHLAHGSASQNSLSVTLEQRPDDDSSGAPSTAAADETSMEKAATEPPAAAHALPTSSYAIGWDHELRVDAAGGVLARGWNGAGQAAPFDRDLAAVGAWRQVALAPPLGAAIRVVQVSAGEAGLPLQSIPPRSRAAASHARAPSHPTHARTHTLVPPRGGAQSGLVGGRPRVCLGATGSTQ
jgi:hypothetical protein